MAETKEPVTLSGWYALTDGRVQYFGWESGQLKDGRIAENWEEVRKFEAEAEAFIDGLL